MATNLAEQEQKKVSSVPANVVPGFSKCSARVAILLGQSDQSMILCYSYSNTKLHVIHSLPEFKVTGYCWITGLVQ